MKRSIAVVAAVLMLIGVAPAFAAAPTVAEDAIRLSQAKVSDDAIIAFVQAKREKVEVTAGDIIAMSQAGVSKTVIKAVIDESAARREAQRNDSTLRAYPYLYDSHGSFYGPPVHGFIGLGGYYGGYGHYGRFGFGRHGGWGRGGRH
jgi:hypothetical protein